MAQGLGKNSAITLQLTRENYEALVLRHGQWIKWLKGEKCTCILKTGRVDPSCTNCKGDGWSYTYQKNRKIYSEPLIKLTDTIFKIENVPGKIQKITRVTDGVKDYVFTVDEEYIKVLSVESGKYLYADASISNEIEINTTAEYIGNNRFIADIPKKITEVGSIPGDIVEVIEIKNDRNDEVYTVVKNSRNYIVINTPVDPILEDDTFSVDLKYIEPFRFVILSQVQNKLDMNFLENVGGSSILLFANEYDISDGDVIVSLVAEIKKKEITVKENGLYDTLPDFYIKSVEKIVTPDSEYLPEVDFVLEVPNIIKWITTPPDMGTYMSIDYLYKPAYRVLKEFPNVRSSEDKLLPRRVALKLLNIAGDQSEGVY